MDILNFKIDQYDANNNISINPQDLGGVCARNEERSQC